MPTIFDESFLNDMNDSYMMESILGNGYGRTIDHMVDKELSKVHLFESEEDRSWNNAISGAENVMDNEYESMLDDGEMIDEVL